MNAADSTSATARLTYFARHPSSCYIIAYTVIFAVSAVVSAAAKVRGGNVAAPELAPVFGNGMSDGFLSSLSAAADICAGDVLQLVIIALLSLALPAAQCCALIVAWRGVALGLASACCAAPGAGSAAILLLMSYFISSLFIIWLCAFTVVFSYRIRPLWGTKQLIKDGCAAAYALCWLCICGSTVLMRLMPYLFIR